MRAGLTARTTCVFMVSQVLSEVQQKLKEWVKPKDNTPSVGLTLERGVRMLHVAKVSTAVEAERTREESSGDETVPHKVQLDICLPHALTEEETGGGTRSAYTIVL